MPETVYGRLETINRLIVDAEALANEVGESCWRFTEAAHAVAGGEMDEADYILRDLEERVADQNVLTYIRDARQLVVALQEEWSE